MKSSIEYWRTLKELSDEITQDELKLQKFIFSQKHTGISITPKLQRTTNGDVPYLQLKPHGTCNLHRKEAIELALFLLNTMAGVPSTIESKNE